MNVLYMNKIIPEKIYEKLIHLKVDFIDFNGIENTGVLETFAELGPLYREVFRLCRTNKFPLSTVKPIYCYNWSDEASCVANNTSCFNYRSVEGKHIISKHASSEAIDFNPWLNPWCNKELGNLPPGSHYDPMRRGSLVEDMKMVKEMESLGFSWGGFWKEPDYQHFEL